MVLTEEQKERIRQNRERAYRIQRERKERLQKEEEENKRKRIEQKDTKKQKREDGKDEEESKEEELVIMEDWERGLSEWATKKEAMKMYCLPEGTLAVCEVQEKENPRHKGWTPMKLYRRSELRKRAHKRHGGLEGLVAERTKRGEKRLAKDMEEAAKLFK